MSSMRQRRAELDSELLDESEQKTMIDQMYNQNEHWNNIFRYILAGIAGFLALYKVYCVLVGFSQPFSHGSHFGYSTSFSYFTIMFFEFLSAVSFAGLALAAHPHIMRGYLRQWIHIFNDHYSNHIFTLFVCVPLFLLVCMYRPDLWLDNILLFGGNVAVSLVSYYVNSSATATRREIMGLKNYTYNYKKA